MSKSGASIKWGGFDKALNNAIDKLGDKRRELMEGIGEILISSTQKRFQDEKAPDGTAWEKSAGPGKTMTKTRRLANSIDSAATLDDVMVGSNLVYARIRQKGGTIKAKNKKFLRFTGTDGQPVFVKEVTQPAREYLGINDDDLEEVAAFIGDYLEDAFKGD